MTRFLRMQKQNDSKSKGFTAKNLKTVVYPPRLISQDFLMLAQKKNTLIEKKTQDRATEMGRLNTYEEFETENPNSEVKKSSTDQKSKKSEEGTHSKNSPEPSFKNMSQIPTENQTGKNTQPQSTFDTIELTETPT